MTHIPMQDNPTSETSRWSCTQTENQLRESVTDPRLRASLTAIRQTVDYIWDTDSPRMIQDSIDRGMSYCKRLVDIVALLLAANNGRTLSGQEMYLLLAGIYLHGVGLQCDVVSLPEIRKYAEELGGRFVVTDPNAPVARAVFAQPDDAKRTTSSKRLRDTPHRTTPIPTFQRNRGSVSPYSIDQQKAIRKNYHYLSAAWIEYAHRTGETDLGPAAMTVPAYLIDDLIDVCLYHTRLPITHCALNFTFEPHGRKQLIAALIRFAAELDVELDRAPLATINTYTLNPRSAVYWWLHHRTTMSFIARNVLRLTTRLHPNDISQYGSFLHDAFIIEFQNKNAPALNILQINGIPMVIDPSSQIVAAEEAETLPADIINALQESREGRGPLFDLANEVRTWLVATRYEVSDPRTLNHRIVEMRATIDQGTVRQRVLIVCVQGQISPSDVEMVHSKLDLQTPQGWLISDQRVSDLARRRAANDDAVEVFHLADFLQQRVWGPYVDALTALVERDHITEHYVDLSCKKEEKDQNGCPVFSEHHASLQSFIDAWLTMRGQTHLTILGESGAGKTWFCRQYAYRQLKRYLKNPVQERLPLLITLRDFVKPMNVRQLISDALLEQYKLLFVGSAYDIFAEMNRRGKILLILDGFDEMPRREDYQSVVENFWELAELLDEHSKIILTSCTLCFQWSRESSRIKTGVDQHDTIVLSSSDFEVVHLEPLADEQVTQVIVHQEGKADGPVAAEHILNHIHLATIARKPLHITLLLSALQRVSSEHLQHVSHVYLYATDIHLVRNLLTERTFRSTADKLFFLCELAWNMLSRGELRTHYRAIPPYIKAFCSHRPLNDDELDVWDYDTRHQTFLRRDVAGYYEFAHKSLVEYFVALKFAAEIGCLHPRFSQVYGEADVQPFAFPIEQKPLRHLLTTFGKLPLQSEHMYIVGNLLAGMLRDDAADTLWQLIDETRNSTPEQVRHVCSNAITLLHMYGEIFRGANLAHTMLTAANLQQADLTGADMSGAILIAVNFAGATMTAVNLRGAYLRQCNLSGCILNDADLRDANLVALPVWTCTMDIQCQGMRIGGMRGLEQEIIWIASDGTEQTMTMREFLLERGAIEE